MQGILLFAHGAREAEWARPFEEIRARIRKARPEWKVELAFLEIMSPSIEEAIDALANQGAAAITVFPLFMAQGAHLKQDVPKILESIRASRPHIPIALQTSIGEVPEILDAISAWILEGVA